MFLLRRHTLPKHLRTSVVSIHLKESLPVVNINYLLMTYNFKVRLRYLLWAWKLYCRVKLNAQPSDYSHYSKKFKIHYLFELIVIIKFVLLSHDSETHFPYKNLVIAQVGAIPLIMYIFLSNYFLGLWL